ncbi:hypothetical protein FRB91_012062 [Serendipita sp. 411]|nr:hypothetical protein FRB91_012062 [Serendipita sp. 411]
MSRTSIDSSSGLSNGAETSIGSSRTGYKNANAVEHSRHSTDGSTILDLQEELERTRAEKETLQGQYQSLLDRLSEMKSKIGLKLQQDAEELEQRETLIATLTSQNEDLQSTITSLHSELASTNTESERLTKELDSLRNSLRQQQLSSTVAHSTEVSSLTAEAHSLRDQVKEGQELLERARLEKEEWEKILMEERVSSETLRGENRLLRKEAEAQGSMRRKFELELEDERQRAKNLETVLTEFEADQERSLVALKTKYTKQIDDLTQLLAEFKSRALSAEVELQTSNSGAHRVEELEREVKEKSVLLAKVRQEAVTLNEHLIQALRRLRKFSADPSSSSDPTSSPIYVDRRLVTNILLQFITTPRADRKRFEMLNLLGSILGWGEEERRQAGLQRGTGSPMTASGMSTPKTKGASLDDEKSDDSFSKMWVEFLLKESSQGGTGQPTTSSPGYSNSPSVTPSSYAPSQYAKSNYAASSVGGGGSPISSSFSTLPTLPSLPSSGLSNQRASSSVFRLPSLSNSQSTKLQSGNIGNAGGGGT